MHDTNCKNNTCKIVHKSTKQLSIQMKKQIKEDKQNNNL